MKLKYLSLAALLGLLTPFPAQAADLQAVKLNNSGLGLGITVAKVKVVPGLRRFEFSPIVVEDKNKVRGGAVATYPITDTIGIGVGTVFQNESKHFSRAQVGLTVKL